MENKEKLFEKKFIEIIFYIITFLFTFMCYFIFKPSKLSINNRNGVLVKTFILFLIIIICLIFYFLHKKHKLTSQLMVLFFILISYLIRLGYMLNTSYEVRQYDTITYSPDGHAFYAYTIFSTGKLPTSNSYQFYHPPLNASIQALFMQITKNIVFPYGLNKDSVEDIYTLFQTCQILSVFYTTIISCYSYKILKELNIKGKGFWLAFAFANFFPRFVQLSGQLNNDVLCIMFCYFTIYYSIKWYKKTNLYHTIMLALSIGLAMCTKISGATICVTPAILFIMKLVNYIKEKKSKKEIINLFLLYTLFLLICAPIGLWFQVYAKIRFDQPLGYVFNNLMPDLSTAQYSIFDRFFSILNFKEIFSNLFCDAWENYSVFNYLIKSAIFGEFSYWQGEEFAFASVFFNYIFVFSFIALIIYYLVKTKKGNGFNKLIALSIIITQLVSYIYFNIKMPYGCTMDFRYIVPIIIGMTIMLGDIHNYFEGIKKTKFVNFVSLCTILFLISSNIFYLLCI